jgi:hypothetical protein
VSKKELSKHEANVQGQRTILLPHLGIGFGSLKATAENTPPGYEPEPEMAEIFKAASNCFDTVCGYCCCMCCIQCFSRMNNQCLIALNQFCIGLGCLACLECCSHICCCGDDNWNQLSFEIIVFYHIEIAMNIVALLEMYMSKSSVLICRLLFWCIDF